MLKIHAHTMLLSTQFNTIQTVQTNLANAFKDFARKCARYVKALGKRNRPSAKLMIRKSSNSRHIKSTKS